MMEVVVVDDEEKNKEEQSDSDDSDDGLLKNAFSTSNVLMEFDDDDLNFPSMTEKQLWDKDVEIGKEEFDAVFENWTNFPRKWKKLHPKELHDVKKVDPVEHLMNLDAKVWLAAAETINKKNGCFGLLPDMWKCLPCQLGALWSQSFVERMNSAGNLLVTKDKMNLGDDLIEKLVVLRMNKEFMKFMRTERPSLIVNQLKPSKN